MLVAGFCFLVLSSHALGQVPLFEQVPYDEILLDEHNKNEVLRVRPLQFPNRRLPDPLPKSGKLEVRLMDRPESVYEVQWHSIEGIKLFEQLVLEKATELVQAGRFEDAYDHFGFLLKRDPKLPDLDRAIDDFLFREAETFRDDGQHAAALARLRELFGRNPQYAGLEQESGLATDKLVEEQVKADNHWAARQLLDDLAQMFAGHAIVKKWEDQFTQEAAALLAEGRKAIESGQLREAHRLGRRLMHVWPDLPEGRAFIDSAQRQYPRVMVGVTMPAEVVQPCRLHDWAARRSSRLVYRTLMEFVGRGTEGGEYDCPLGTWDPQRLKEGRTRLVFQLTPDLRWSAGADALTGPVLARELLAMADPARRVYQPDWAKRLDQVSVEGVYTVNADLGQSHVRPAALLRTVVVRGYPSGDSGGPPLFNGPYAIQPGSDEEVVYLANPQYFAAGPNQPKEIVEHYYRKGTEAIGALQRRQIDVLDRVNPWDLEKVREIPGVVVEPYAVPLVHCLVANPRKPFTARRKFRRALVYGIHREAILRHLVRGDPPPGCQVVSGPLSPGISADDPLDYAYDHSIAPRDYEPGVAIALKEVALTEVAKAKEQQAVKLEGMPRFVLAHPPHEIARVACTSIQRQLALVGIAVTLRELPPGMPAQIPDDVDLMYVELAVWEPLVDARRVLGQEGISGGSTNHMSLALRQLDEAIDWAQASARLRSIHWLAHSEVSLVPLWQLTDHFAYHRSLQGVAARPVSLYQDVEMWQAATQYAAEGE